MSDRPHRFVILGGGTAGWMAACLIARAWPQHHVTVVESPDIGIIGVGEGSTPQLKGFFDTLGIAETEWMPACSATYKTGIGFHGWSATPGYESYFHPFASDVDVHTAPQFMFHTRARRTGRDVCAHPDRFFLATRLAQERRAPFATENFPFKTSYGYHFDSVLVGRFLRGHAVDRLGVTHLARTIGNVVFAAGGDVAQLRTTDGDDIFGDLFIDASGFRGTIVQEAMREPFVSFADTLFNDRAVAIPTPREPGPTPCETRATALSAGWTWKIPLTSRIGNGYVYSSAYCSAEAAEAELRAHLGAAAAGAAARHLTMKVGRIARAWVRNAVAIGLSQGFIEPLEATALHIVQSSVEDFIAGYDPGARSDRDAFNQTNAARYDGIRDYIVAHYRLARRADTDYWRDCAANPNLSDNLKAFMTAWFRGEDLVALIEATRDHRAYAPFSWHCLMAGYGNFPAAEKLKASAAGLQLADMAWVDDFVTRCAGNFVPHDDRLAALDRGHAQRLDGPRASR